MEQMSQAVVRLRMVALGGCSVAELFASFLESLAISLAFRGN